MSIYAFHLLNDYSGSPKVLSQLIKSWTRYGYKVNLVTGSGREGFLSDLEDVNYIYFRYSLAANPWIRLFKLTFSQLHLFFILLFKVKFDDVVYINTVLPFGAAFLGKIKGCRVIYHVHETSMKPALLKRFLFGVAKWAASDVIYVSKFLAEQEPFPDAKNHIFYNAIEDDFLRQAQVFTKSEASVWQVLMVCSLKDYKGVKEYWYLAQDNPQYQFNLVLNASQAEIDAYFEHLGKLSNLHLYPTQTNLHPFYQKADIILNLSRPDGWVETFGLTIIEGMAYGLPAIVPPVGGITELVEPQVNGLQVDSRDRTALNEALNTILNNEALYQAMRTAALQKIQQYSEAELFKKSIDLVK